MTNQGQPGGNRVYWIPEAQHCVALRDKATGKVFYQRIENRLVRYSDDPCDKCKGLKLNEPFLVERPAMKMLGRSFISVLCDILGIAPSRVRSMKIVAHVNDAVRVEIEQFATVGQCEKIAEAMKGNDVVEVKEAVQDAIDAKNTCTCTMPAGSPHTYPCPQWKPEQ